MFQNNNIKASDLNVLIRNSALQKGVREVVIEKDYWVSYLLHYLFHENKWSDYFTFKGGTSLSKCYKLIERFSEDVDLILDWRVLGYTKNEPWKERSNTKQGKFNEEINIKTIKFLREDFLPEIKKDLEKLLGEGFGLYLDDLDPQTILFKYPGDFKTSYLPNVIRLEIGSLAAWTPAKEVNIKPYIADYYPRLFTAEGSKIRTVSAERSFWEKVTILHHEANRPKASEMPKRYSRHYYDVYNMGHSRCKDSALKDLELLNEVTNFKIKFYPRKWARYEDVLKGEVKLLPGDFRIQRLAEDYASMRDMFFQEEPAFNELMDYIGQLEKEINNR